MALLSDIVAACATLVKPGGWVFFSTLNRNLKSYLFAVIGAVMKAMKGQADAGKVRELIVDEEKGPGPVRYTQPGADLVGRVDCLAEDHTPGNACETPADDQRHGGKLGR